MDKRPNRTTTSGNRGHENKPFSLTLSPSELADLDRQPRIFGPAELHNSSAHAELFTAVFTPTNVAEIVEESECEEDVAIVDDQQRGLSNILTQERQKEIQKLEIVVSQRPSDDEAARSIVNMLHLPRNQTNATVTTMHIDNDNREEDADTVSMTSQPVYPPVNRTGEVQDHDRPFVEYGHLDRETIARECKFNWDTTLSQSQGRFRGRCYAIAAYTRALKDDVKKYLLEDFGENKIEYICIDEDIDQANGQRRLLIQVIFMNRIDRRKAFLIDIIGDNCTYKVTDNDLAWNEYIKQNNSYCEHKKFKSIQALDPIKWKSLSTSASALPTVFDVPDTPLNQQPSSVSARPTVTKRPLSARIETEKRRKIDDDIARNALGIAEDDVELAMDYIKQELPSEFMRNRKWYLDTFKYVRLRAEEKADREGTIDKEYVWPDSFPDCTPKLREVVERWIKHHFFRAKRAKCLVLIGPTGTGKTSFALSLPGRVNYFKERWNLDKWSDYARYSVFDDIPWDDFKAKGFPEKKNLLTQNGVAEANGKYREITTINVRQPSIVLLNPENAGSLTALPRNAKEEAEAAYWKARATVYIMEPGEYFYKPHIHGQNSGTSATSSIGTNEPRLGGPEEFDAMRQRFYEK